MIGALALAALGLVLGSCACLAIAKALRLQGLEALGWAMALAPPIQATIYGGLIAVGIQPSSWFMLCVLAAISLLLCLRFTPRFETLPRGPLVLVVLMVSIAGCAVFAFTAVAEPFWATDFLAIWGLKAKTIFETASIPGRLFHDPALFWAHPEYPMGVPLALAAIATTMRAWNDQALGLVYAWWQVATVAVAAGFLLRRISRNAAAFAAIVIALFFPLYRQAHLGTGEIPLALALLLLGSAFLDALDVDVGIAALPRLAAAMVLVVTTKQEGSLFAVLLATSLLVVPGSRRVKRMTAATLVLVPLLHAVAMRVARGPAESRDFDLSLLWPRRWESLGERLLVVIQRVATVEVLSAALPLATILVILLATRPTFADRLLLPLVLQAALYVFVCALSAFDPIWHVQASVGRISLALFPTLALVLGARLGTARAAA
jgi:hypothetical protein